MKLIFLDESGYSKNWKKDIERQPYHVLSAVALDADRYAEACSGLRRTLESIDELELKKPFAQGFEIKAKEVSRGKGWWASHNTQRNQVRDAMLLFPAEYDATAFVVVIDKENHCNRYAIPDPPHEIAFRFIFERIQWHLIDENDVGICIYDQTKFLDDEIHDASIELIRDGSQIEYISEFFGYVSTNFQIDRVLEFSLGKSENSVGIQVADYYAHFAYQYFKKGNQESCGWWENLTAGLYAKEGSIEGYGLKVFP